VVTDPVTGEIKKKKKMGGAYPGQMGQQHAAYQPPASAFQNGQATAHFVSYGGGNALTLVQPDGSSKPQHGGPGGKFIRVTLPQGVESGQTIRVKAPDGRLNEIIIPPGFGPGMTFTVEFAPESAAPAAAAASSYSSTMMNNKIPAQQAAQMNNTRPTTTSSYGNDETPYASLTPLAPPPNTNHQADDGFASGFNNPNWSPPPPTTQQANGNGNYPTSQAVPVGGTGPYATAKLY